MAAGSSDEAFLEAFVKACEEVRLEAIVVGATAGVLHDAPLMTRDLDILVRDTPLNRKKLEKLAQVLGRSKPRSISELTSAVTMDDPDVPIDVLFDWMPGPLRFASVKSRAVRIPVGSRTALVASLEDVIKSKAASGRPKDEYHLIILRDTLRVKEVLARGDEPLKARDSVAPKPRAKAATRAAKTRKRPSKPKG